MSVYFLNKWISFIKQSFLSKELQEDYIELITERYKVLLG